MGFFGRVLLVGPRCPSPGSHQQAVRQSYVKLIKASAAYWHSVRGAQPVFDGHWIPLMKAGLKEACLKEACSQIRPPPLLTEMKSTPETAPAEASVLRGAVFG